MEKYIIALDLDGTIIENIYDIKDYTIKVFKKLNELGHKIIITTGRPFRSSFFVYEKMGLDTLIINYNGEYVHNPKTKEVINNTHMERSECLKIYNDMKDKYSHIFFEIYDDIYANVDDPFVYPLMHKNELANLYCGDLNNILKENINGCLILSKPGCGKDIVDYINNSNFKVKARMWNWKEYSEIIELYLIDSDKSISFKMVMDYYGISEDHAIATGDSNNDYNLFKLVKFSVCPNNAVQRIKDISSVVLDLECKDEGIARFFNDYFELGIKYDN